MKRTILRGIRARENGKARFAVVALGRPPLSYQWYGDNALLPGATSRALVLDPVTTGGQAGSFRVVDSNDSDSVTSTVATLALTTNRPPILPSPTLVGTYSNVPVSVSIADLVYGSTDPDGDPISFLSADTGSTNGGPVVQNGLLLTYTPVTDFVGMDEFTYTLTDGIDFPVGVVDIQVSPFLSPTFSSTVVAGTNLVFRGSGGAIGATFQVLTSTNLTTPLTNWTAVGSGAFNLSGQFNITNSLAPGVPQQFYILSIPKCSNPKSAKDVT